MEKTEHHANHLDPSDQWARIVNSLAFFKFIIFTLSLVIIGLAVKIGFLLYQPPIVVLTDGKTQSFHVGKIKPVSIGEVEIKQTVEQFIKLRFSWDKLDPSQMTANLAPLTTKGFNQKVLKALIELRDEKLQKKETRQTVANIRIEVTDNRIIATFDKVLRVENVPLIVPTQISFNIVKGEQTEWNPTGLYINGIIEHSEV